MSARRQLLIVCLLAFSLRLAGLDWGLPNDEHYFSYHPDEVTVTAAAVSVASTGDLNPHFFNYGSLYIYLVALFLAPFGGSTPATATLVARLITVAFGVGTVALLFAYGRRALGPKWGWAPALLLALLPLHVVHSHFATVDVAAGFFALLVMWLTFLAISKADSRLFIAAGAAAGLAAATKYNAGVSLLLPVAAAAMTPGGSKGKARAALGAIGACAAAFLVACPYAVLDWPAFREGVLFEARHGRIGGTYAFLGTLPAPLYHLLNGLPNGATPFFVILLLAGVVVAIRKRESGVAVALGWLVIWWFAISLSKEKFIRYLIPALPAMVILACLPVAVAREKWRWRALALAWSGLTLVACALVTIAHLHAFSTTDPRDRAAQWVRERAAGGEAIALLDAPWYTSPPISPWNGGLRTKAQFEEWNESARWRIVPLGWEMEPLLEGGADYVVFADAEVKDLRRVGDPRAKALDAALAAGYGLGETFDGKPRLLGVRMSSRYPPPDWEYVTPTVYVYQRLETKEGDRR